MEVPFIDLKGQLDDCGGEMERAIIDVIRSCRYILGDRGKALEDAIAGETGVAHAVGVASGTDALILSLRALGLRAGRKVVVPAFSFCASVSAVIFAGGKPHFVDIDERTFNMDIEQALDSNGDIAGYLPVHLYGLPARVDTLSSAASERGRFVLEDCAQAYGASLNGHRVGSMGNAGILSFYPTKNLSAPGEGGMVVTDDGETAKKCRLMRNHGEEVRYHHSVLGRNSRLDEIQAAALLAKLQNVPGWNERRRKIASIYDRELDGIGDVITPLEPDGCRHVYNLYVIRTAKRDELREHLRKREIGTGVYYPLGMHRQPIFEEFIPDGRKFPATEKVCGEVLALPMYAHLTESQAGYVIESIKAFFSN